MCICSRHAARMGLGWDSAGVVAHMHSLSKVGSGERGAATGWTWLGDARCERVCAALRGAPPELWARLNRTLEDALRGGWLCAVAPVRCVAFLSVGAEDAALRACHPLDGARRVGSGAAIHLIRTALHAWATRRRSHVGGHAGLGCLLGCSGCEDSQRHCFECDAMRGAIEDGQKVRSRHLSVLAWACVGLADDAATVGLQRAVAATAVYPACKGFWRVARSPAERVRWDRPSLPKLVRIAFNDYNFAQAAGFGRLHCARQRRLTACKRIEDRLHTLRAYTYSSALHIQIHP